MISSLLWNVTQRRLLVTDISGQITFPIFKDPTVQGLLRLLHRWRCER